MLKSSKVVVAMSGGVDSSATVFLLQKQGYEVMGIFMRLINNSNDEQAARRVCAKLAVKFYPINYSSQFKKEVIDYFIESYKKGLTPNPCVRCNRLIKFGALLKSAREIGADFLATGHYVRSKKLEVRSKNYLYKLYRGKDKNKDQSYFLYNLTQKQLARILFPLGEYEKEKIKKIADKAKLPYLTKESQDVCFLKGDHNDFLREHIKLKSGPIKTMDGKKIGKHQGLPLYTIGQRRGVEIGGVGPFYVAKCDYKTNTLYVVSDGDDPALYSDELIADDVNWISGKEPKMPLTRQVVIRYRHKPAESKIIKLKVESKTMMSTMGCNPLLIKFKKPQRAVTPGQSIVFYQGEEMLGGGIIKYSA